MAYYAFLDSNNVVVEIIPGRDENETVDGISDWEAYYTTKRDGLTCKRTSYNTMAGVHLNGGEPFRMNYAGIGYTYDEERDAFIPPKPYDSWVLNEGTCLFEAPIPMPEDGGVYSWDEQANDWVEIQEPSA
jgi:hypothetical protein